MRLDAMKQAIGVCCWLLAFLDLVIAAENGLQYGKRESPVGPASTGEMSTAAALRSQFSNPKEVLAILLLIGGDTVQQAIAQLSGHKLTPVAFSFGWVAYAFGALQSAFGEAILMPRPDCAGYVINLGSGMIRQNESWMVGRLIRDLEFTMEKLEAGEARRAEDLIGASEGEKTLRRMANILWVRSKRRLKLIPRDIESVFTGGQRFKKEDPEKYKPVVTIFKTTDHEQPAAQPKGDVLWWSFVVFVFLQMVLAMVPLALREHEWRVFYITVAGTGLAAWTSSIPTWGLEKYRCRQDSTEDFIITRGNGHKWVFVIQNGRSYEIPSRVPGKKSIKKGISLHLEDLAKAQSEETPGTRLHCIVLAIFWIVLLISVGGLERNAWYLLGVGGIGMVHNVIAASRSRTPEAHGVPLAQTTNSPHPPHESLVWRMMVSLNLVFHPPQYAYESFKCGKKEGTMDLLKRVDVAHPGMGLALLRTFFPGDLRPDEELYWAKMRSHRKARKELRKAGRSFEVDASGFICNLS